MRFALDQNSNKIEVKNSGQRAICPCCNNEVIGRNGRIRPKHWYHKSLKQCDSWYEPITEWHLKWQNYFPEKYQEVVLKDLNGNVHIADICLRNGLVIEIQNSPIDVIEIEQREKFYTKSKGLIWIINGENLLKKCSIKYQFIKKEFSIIINLPDYLKGIKGFDFDNLRDEILELKEVKSLCKLPSFKKLDIANGFLLKFIYSYDDDLENRSSDLKDTLWEYLKKNYRELLYNIWTNSECWSITNEKDMHTNIKLRKKYWRKFIDIMKSPVFIDNLNGLDAELLYWYQENKIVKKQDFLNKYRSYT